MSSSVPMQLDAGVKTAFSDGMVRVIKVVISEDEQLKLSSKTEKSSSESGDYDRMKALVSATEPCYLLFRFNSGNGWAIVTYVPDSAPVKSKMTYAATKATLKTALGNDAFKEDLQASEPSDLSWDQRSSPAGADKPYSQREKHIMELDRMETSARSEFSQGLTNRSPSPAPSSSPSGSGRSSGYHTVNLPLAPGADAKLRELRAAAPACAELCVSAAMDALEHVATFPAPTAAALAARLSTTEPRFYVYARASRSGSPPAAASNASGGAGGVAVFLVYCCPPASDRKLRMVYSTAKGAAMAHAEKALGAPLRRAVEVSEAEDVTEETFADARGSVGAERLAKPAAGAPADNRARAGTAGSRGGSMNGKDQGAAHPVYGLMNQGGTTSSTTKKIVIPPSYAWQ